MSRKTLIPEIILTWHPNDSPNFHLKWFPTATTFGEIPYSGLFSRRLYFANFAKAQPILENKNLERQLLWEEAWFNISIREITFREQELNWLFAKYKRLENNPLYTVCLNNVVYSLFIHLPIYIHNGISTISTCKYNYSHTCGILTGCTVYM